MAVIVPFRGIRYNEKKIRDLSEVITPPYDVITPEEQEQYYRRSPYNFIRLEYGKTFLSDRAGENRYMRAAAAFKAWMAEKVLQLEEQSSFYLYRQTFAVQGTTYHRTGLIAALRLEPYASKVILPHEDTLASPKADRLELLRVCRANFSPIFGLFPDPEQKFAGIYAPLQESAPLVETTDAQGQSHTLWKIADPPTQETLARLMATRQIFIADGHHRYDTALQYSREADLKSQPGGRYVMAVLVALEDPGLVILPFHRLISGLSESRRDLLQENVRKHFQISVRGNPEQLDPVQFMTEIDGEGKKGPAMGLLLRDQALLLTLKDKCASGELDVSLLKRLILEPLTGGLPDAGLEHHLDFSSSAAEAHAALLNGRAEAVFLLNSTPIEAVTARALQGENMPQKSTCFYPKLHSGLVVHHLELGH